MADRRVWALCAGEQTLAHARWIGGHELVLDGPHEIVGQVEAWFLQETRMIEDQSLSGTHVRTFFEDMLPTRFAGFHIRLVNPKQVPPQARWLLAVDEDKIPPPGVRDPFGWASNRWAEGCNLLGLVDATQRGAIRWARGSHTGFKAGGRCPDNSEMWLTLVQTERTFLLLVRRHRLMWAAPVRQKQAWLFHGPLQRMHRTLESRL